MSEDRQQLSLDDLDDINHDAPGKTTDERGDREPEAETHLTDLIRSRINDRQELLLAKNFGKFRTWMLKMGKNPNRQTGLAETTADNYVSRLDKIYRTLWSEFTEGTPLSISRSHASELCEALEQDALPSNEETYSVSHKQKINDTLRKYFEWKADEDGENAWEPPYEFNDQTYQSPDNLTRQERRLLREAAVTLGTLPSYSDTTPEQRDKLKGYLAQKLEKPKADITPTDWKANNRSFERPSLVWTALDAALRPIEVSRAREGWLRLEKNSLYIPREHAAKSRDNWEVALKGETVEALSQWQTERSSLVKYDDTDRLWLTRENNPWGSNALNYLFDQLCEKAGIDRTNRRLCWYSIRHSVGEHMTEKGGLNEAKAQLRNKSIESTLQYTDPSIESRQSTLRDME